MGRSSLPKYRRQRRPGRGADLAFVEFSGRRHYLGPWGSEESRELYRQRLRIVRTVPGLRRGRTDAPETRPVLPVPQEHIEALAPHVSREVWALIRLQLLTGARSGELVQLRPCDLDMSGPVWVYCPADHKNSHRGHQRSIYLGPQAQEVLRPFLADRPLQAYCFSPIEAERTRRIAAHERRKTPASSGNVPGSNRKLRPERAPGERYDTRGYGRAIARACVKAGVPHWHPHQLRHTTATRLRREFGIDTARVLLGHKSPVVTDIYAELDRTKAIEVASRIG